MLYYVFISFKNGTSALEFQLCKIFVILSKNRSYHSDCIAEYTVTPVNLSPVDYQRKPYCNQSARPSVRPSL